VDGSDHSFRAADFAMKMAGDYGAKLFVVTVTHIPEKYHVSQYHVLIILVRITNSRKNFFEKAVKSKLAQNQSIGR
jgi:hypothetical protein